MTTTQEQIDNLSKVISDMESGVYTKGRGKLAEYRVHRYVDADPPADDQQQLAQREFCCLGCMAWQMGARPEHQSISDSLYMTIDEKQWRLGHTFPPLLVSDAFGLNVRHYPANITPYDGKITTSDEDGYELIEDVNEAYGKLARLNDESVEFGDLVIPQLLITLGVLEVRRAYELTSELV